MFDAGNKMETIRQKLIQIMDILRKAEIHSGANMIEDALSRSDEELKPFLVSNELWGGSGSIADQASKEVAEILVQLGEIQIKMDVVNVRTQMWTDAYRNWLRDKRI